MRNIKKFLIFLIATFAHSVTIFVSTLIFQIRRAQAEAGIGFNEIIGIIILAFSGMIVLLMIVGILHQSCAISTNRTTNECLRSRLPKKIFDEGCSKNWSQICNA